MNMNRILSLFLAFFCSTAFLGCSDDKAQDQQVQHVPSVDELYGTVQKVERDFSQGFLLRNATDRDKQIFSDTLYQIKLATLRLRKNPSDTEALSLLYLASTEYDSLKILANDDPQLEDLKQKLRATLDVIARMQGKTLDNIERVLFEKDFDYELSPFVALTEDNKSGWVKSNHYENHFAKVSGSRMSSWMFTPRFDLTGVRNPSFNLRQAISNRGYPFDNSVFFAVSEDYAGGDPAKASWELLTVQRLPDGSGYTSIDSENVSLAQYEGKSIVIAFHYDTRKADNYPTWQMSRFRLMGAGELASTALQLTGAGAGRPVAFEKNFNKEGEKLDPFAAYTKKGMGGWKMGTYKGTGKTLYFAHLDFWNSSKEPLLSWLLSPRFDLSEVSEPGLRITSDMVGGDDMQSSISVVVSEDYTGGDPETATWKAVNIKNLPKGEKFTSASNTDIADLAEYAGKSIVVAIKVDKQANGKRLQWQIEAIRLFGTGKLSYAPVKVPASAGGNSSAPAASGNGGARPASNGSTRPAPAPLPPQPNVAEICPEKREELFSFQFAQAELGSSFTKVDPNSVIAAPNASYSNVIRFSGFRGGSNVAGQAWLLSKEIDINSRSELCLSLSDDAYFAKAAIDLSQIQVLVATDYAGDVNTANWKVLEFAGRKTQKGLVNKTILAPKTNGLLLKDIIPEGSSKLVIALRYTSTAESAPWWGVSNLTLTAAPASSQAPAPAAVEAEGETEGEEKNPASTPSEASPCPEVPEAAPATSPEVAPAAPQDSSGPAPTAPSESAPSNTQQSSGSSSGEASPSSSQ